MLIGRVSLGASKRISMHKKGGTRVTCQLVYEVDIHLVIVRSNLNIMDTHILHCRFEKGCTPNSRSFMNERIFGL